MLALLFHKDSTNESKEDNLTELPQEGCLSGGESGDLGDAGHQSHCLTDTQAHHGVGQDQENVVDEDRG